MKSQAHHINAAWHKKNRMPKNPTLDQRLAWHVAHAEHCTCREMPENLRLLIRRFVQKK